MENLWLEIYTWTWWEQALAVAVVVGVRRILVWLGLPKSLSFIMVAILFLFVAWMTFFHALP